MQQRITGTREVIAFRNRLIHGYAEIDDAVVWAIIEEDLTTLIEDARRALDDVTEGGSRARM
jgi:uncharacterized protein with HEPN domain